MILITETHTINIDPARKILFFLSKYFSLEYTDKSKIIWIRESKVPKNAAPAAANPDHAPSSPPFKLWTNVITSYKIMSTRMKFKKPKCFCLPELIVFVC